MPDGDDPQPAIPQRRLVCRELERSRRAVRTIDSDDNHALMVSDAATAAIGDDADPSPCFPAWAQVSAPLRCASRNASNPVASSSYQTEPGTLSGSSTRTSASRYDCARSRPSQS